MHRLKFDCSVVMVQLCNRATLSLDACSVLENLETSHDDNDEGNEDLSFAEKGIKRERFSISGRSRT